MTEELKEIGLEVGHRRVGRVRRENASPDHFLILLTPPERHIGCQNPQIQGHNGPLPGRVCAACPRGGNHTFNIAPNPLNRNFAADQPNQKWVADISYIWTIDRQVMRAPHREGREGWLYLAAVLDLYSRRVIGWAVSNRMKRDLVIRALEMAIALRRPPKGCIHHPDRGSQYCSHDYQKLLRRHSFKVSPLMHVNMHCRAVHERQRKLL